MLKYEHDNIISCSNNKVLQWIYQLKLSANTLSWFLNHLNRVMKLFLLAVLLSANKKLDKFLNSAKYTQLVLMFQKVFLKSVC
ncbi:hypothetical protein [Erwinia phage COW86c]